MTARRDEFRGEPTDFLVVEWKGWHTTPVQRDAVDAIALRAALARAMPVLAIARHVTAGAWELAQQLDVRILTEQDLWADRLRPLTKRRPPRGTLYARQEPCIQDLQAEQAERLGVVRKSEISVITRSFNSRTTRPRG